MQLRSRSWASEVLVQLVLIACIPIIDNCYFDPCTFNSDCCASSPLCLFNGNLFKNCYDCHTDSDCSIIKPICRSEGICDVCRKNSDCYLDNLTPFCWMPNNGVNQCVHCMDNTACTDPAAPNCMTQGEQYSPLAHKCGCAANTVPYADGSPTQGPCHYDIPSGVYKPLCAGHGCGECLADIDCWLRPSVWGDRNTLCQQTPTGSKCVECLSSAQCAANFATTPVCLSTPSSGKCVQCLLDADCTSSSAPNCLANKVCGCKANALSAACSSTGLLPVCSATSGCVCTSTSCGSLVCSNNACVRCSATIKCPNPSFHFCNQLHLCVSVPCTSSTTCTSLVTIGSQCVGGLCSIPINFSG